MSSYFDDLDRQVRELAQRETPEVIERDPTFFIEAVAALEADVIKTVSLATGDREFPHDLREKIQGVIAIRRVKRPDGTWNEEEQEWALSLKSSHLFSDLHSAFHVVAGLRRETRFGLLTDNPEGIVRRRDAYDVRRELAQKLRDIAETWVVWHGQSGGADAINAASRLLFSNDLTKAAQHAALNALYLMGGSRDVDDEGRFRLKVLAAALGAQDAT